ncbi:MAG: phosphoenolpyruvate--protein phosphotransferase [Sphingomonadales bacterium]
MAHDASQVIELRGVGVSPGVAIGPAYVFDRGQLRVPQYPIGEAAVEREVARFNGAVDDVRQALALVRERAGGLSGAAAEELGYLLDAHLQMLGESRLIRSVRAVIAAEKINAEAAIQASVDQVAADFARIGDPYLAARLEDIREVGRRLIMALTEHRNGDFTHAPPGAILIGDSVSPADVALMDRGRVAGLASGFGGAEGHAAIMARARGLPAVLGVPDLSRHVENGALVVVDGDAGRVIIAPDAETLALFEATRDRQRRQRAQLVRAAKGPAVTADGDEIQLYANIDQPEEIATALDMGAGGIGLMRSEFLYMNRSQTPSEEEQYRTYRAMVETMAGKPITLRTLDAGGEKLVSALRDHFAAAENPALGLRAIRLTLREKPLMETQLAAMLRAGWYGPLRILLPMVTTVDELRQVRAMMVKVARTLLRRGHKVPDPLPPLGAMIEVPAAALAADMLAQESDFLAIGTNDLTMYTLAVDRGNEQVADLYDPLHPAVLRLIQFSTAAARRAQIPVHLCGEMAGDPRLTPLLLGLGLRALSATPLALPAIKQRIRALGLDACGQLAEDVLRGDPAALASVSAVPAADRTDPPEQHAS